jgi:hypothetical protein
METDILLIKMILEQHLKLKQITFKIKSAMI